MTVKPLACKHGLDADQALLYETLVANLTDLAVFLLDPDGCIVTWNPAVERILGYREAEWVGHYSELTFVDEDRAAGVPYQELSAARTATKSSCLRWQRRQDGRRIFCDTTTIALRNDAGILLGFSKLIRDVTHAHQTEMDLRDALSYSESVVDTVREPLVVLDSRLRIRSVSHSFCRLAQVSREGLEGCSIYEIAEGAWDIPVLRTLLEELVHKQSNVEDYVVEHTFPRLGRKIMLLNARRLGREGDHSDHILLAIEDITARTQGERALQASEDQRRLIMDSAPAIISYLDCNIQFRYVNRAYERWFKRSSESLLGKPITELYDESTMAGVMPYIQRALNGETVTFEADYCTSDASFTLQVVYTPDFAPDGEIRGFMVLGIDVSARKAAEKALRQNEERWRSLFEGMHEGFFVGEMLYGADGQPTDFRFQEVNPAFETLTGISNAIGKTLRECIPGIEQELIEHYNQVVTTRQPLQFDIHVAALGNQWFEVRARPTENHCFAVLFLNITKRREIETKLRENEQRQSALVLLGDRLRDEKSLASLVFTAMEILGETLHVARAGYGWVDNSQHFIAIESDWTNGTVPTLAGTYRFDDFGHELGRRLKAGEIVSIPDVALSPITASEKDRWLALNIRAVVNLPLIQNGRLVAVLFLQDAVAREWSDAELSFLRKVADRTWAAAERSRAIEELQQSEEFTRSILASSPDCVKVLDLDGRLMTMNEGGWNQMEVRDESEYLGRYWPEGWGESSSVAEASLQKARAGDTTRFEGSCLTFRGTPKWWEVCVAPIKSVAGEPVRILAISRDITDRKRAEKERERLTADLQRSNDDLSQFAHTVAHDLQSPLRGVTSFAQLLRRNADSRLNDSDREFIRHITESARRMTDLVGGLLRFATVGQGEIAREPVSMDAVLASALESLRVQIEEHGAVIEHSSLPIVMGDSVQLVQLLQNLVSNAIKYARPGQPPLVRISSAGGPAHYVFAIEDNGEGIDEAYLQSIFEPLKRLHGVEIPGTGLGLAMCQRIVARHGGKIWVESTPGRGSSFFFTLPVS